MIEIVLTWAEAAIAAQTGVRRRLHGLQACLQEKNGRAAARPDQAWQDDIEGSAAEFAVAKWAGVFWTPTLVVDGGIDVGRLCIRHTCYPTGRLLIQRGDADQLEAVLVTGRLPVYSLAGWIPVKDAKQDRFWQERPSPDAAPRPCYWIPQAELRPMADLAALKGWAR